MAIALSVGIAVGEPQAGAGASFGALACLYVPQAPYRCRARVVAVVGAGLVLSVLLGALAAGHGYVAVVVAGLVAAAASFLCQAAELPPPRELMLVMAVLAATEHTEGAAAAPARAGLAAAGGLVAWVVTMSPALLDARWPVSVAVEELSVLALSWPAHRTPPGAADGEAFLHHLDGLADAVAGGDVPLPAVPALPGLPRTAAAVGTLTDAVREIGRA